jgi:hypothetical protein
MGLDEIDYVLLIPDVEVCVERVMTRPDHGFRDEAAARKMHGEFARSDVDARHVIVNDGGPDAAVAEVAARLERGELTTTGDPGEGSGQGDPGV